MQVTGVAQATINTRVRWSKG